MSGHWAYRKFFIINNHCKVFGISFFAKYSVIPLSLFFKKVFFEIGPLINLLEISFLINLNAISKQDEIYSFDLDEILSNALFCFKSTLIKFIFFNLSFFLIILFSFTRL